MLRTTVSNNDRRSEALSADNTKFDNVELAEDSCFLFTLADMKKCKETVDEIWDYVDSDNLNRDLFKSETKGGHFVYSRT